MLCRRVNVPLLVSEYVEGELLGRFLARQRGGRLSPFEGLHLLYVLAGGLEQIHRVREYHGDLHADNIIVRRVGLGFQVQLVDMYNWGPPSADNIRGDVCDLVRLFYDAIGGARFYSRHPEPVKRICCGLKRSLILKRFRTAGHLRRHLESMSWE